MDCVLDGKTRLPLTFTLTFSSAMYACQHTAWLKYKKHKHLYGSTSEERKTIDEILNKLEELHIGLTPIIRATLTKNYEERREVWNEFKNTALFPCLQKYDDELKGKRYLISWADIALIEMLTRYQSCYDSFYLAHFPILKEFCDRFEALPHMRPYIQSRPDSHF
ncbi:unnamed protein product [Haemonchus placei]|uniref:GST C-terminal domain-containing protein n=1 Tax=Haemonchus placei TaxID=6290 RepID=A0A0N4VUI9_HAEPC|nr:unnamed protein product [Haemonchus placei]